MNSMRGSVGFVLSLLVLGCSSSGPQAPEGVRFEVLDEHYSAEETIQLMLSNPGPTTLGYNLCLASLERRVTGSWIEVDRYPPNVVCTAELNNLEPGDSVVVPQAIEPWMLAGTYRFRTTIEISTQATPHDRISVISNEFEIRL